jgi:hypothetical protein
MTVNIRSDEITNNTLSVVPVSSAQENSDVNIAQVAGLLHSFLSNVEVVEVSSPSGPSGEDLKAMVTFLLKCVQDIQVRLGQLNKDKDGFSAEIGKAELTSALNATKEANKKYEEYLAQKAEAEKAKKAMEVVGFVLMALAVVVGALTGGVAGFLVAGLMVALQASGAFEKLAETLQKDCGLTKEQAHAVIFAIVLVVSLGSSAGSAAAKGLSSAATTAAEKSVEKVVEKLAEKGAQGGLSKIMTKVLGETLSATSNAALTSGLIQDGAAGLANVIVDNLDDGKTKEEKEKLKALITMILTLVFSIYAMGAGVGGSMISAEANVASKSTHLVSQGLTAILSRISSGNHLQTLTTLTNSVRAGEFMAQMAHSGAEIGQGVIDIEASQILGGSFARAEGDRALYSSLAEVTQQASEADRENFTSAMSSIEALLKRIMEGFNIPDSEAKALAR